MRNTGGLRRKIWVAFIVQMTAISCLIFREPLLGLPVFLIGEWLLGVAAALTLWSGADYLVAAWPTMRKRG